MTNDTEYLIFLSKGITIFTVRVTGLWLELNYLPVSADFIQL